MKANKTGPHDAAGLAQLARTGFYKEMHVKSPTSHGVRSVITARAHLVEARVRLDNTVRGLCATFGIRPGAGQGERFLARVQAAIVVPGLGEAVASLLRARTGLVDEIRRMDRELKAISTASPACQALMSIPGVGVQTSAAFAAAVDEASRFKRSRTAGAYLGLVPRRHQSGELDWTGRITKQGDGTVRKLLYEAANSILTRTRQSFALKTWALKIAKRRGLKKARVALDRARLLAEGLHDFGSKRPNKITRSPSLPKRCARARPSQLSAAIAAIILPLTHFSHQAIERFGSSRPICDRIGQRSLYARTQLHRAAQFVETTGPHQYFSDASKRTIRGVALPLKVPNWFDPPYE